MRIIRAVMPFVILVFLLASHVTQAEKQGQKIITSHGLTLFGDLKYGPGFSHFEYVNPDAPKGGVFTYASTFSLDNLNPYSLTGSLQPVFIYETLMVRSEDEPTSLYGLVAETIAYPDDYSWVEFKLRDSAMWHDGKSITVEDVIFSAEILKTRGSPVWRNFFKDVEKVEKKGSNSVRFIFYEPIDRSMLHGIASACPILPKHYWKNRDISKPSMDIPLMSGPYKITKAEAGRFLVLERVRDYWGMNLPVNRGRYNFDTIRMDVYRDLTIAFEAFLAGNVDFRMERQPGQWTSGYDVPAVRDGRIIKERLESNNIARYTGIYFNLRRVKFQNPKVREAISYAFDWDWVNRNLYHDFYVRLRSYFDNSDLANQGLPSPEELELLEPFKGQLDPRVFTQEYNPPRTDATQASLRGNLRKASLLLKEAGYVNQDGRLLSREGKPMEIEILLNDPSIERMYGSLVANLKLLGINARMRMVDSTELMQRMRTFDFDMMNSLDMPRSISPSSSEHRNYWGSRYADKENGLNYIGIKSPAIDALIENLDFAKDRAEKVAAVRALDRALVWGFYSIPLHYSPDIPIAYWDRFGRPVIKPEWIRYLMVLTPNSWWIDQEKDAALKKARGFKQ
ncbi:extracellular solute-binding protein [Thermodesulfobacteriota bacterium]